MAHQVPMTAAPQQLTAEAWRPVLATSFECLVEGLADRLFQKRCWQ